jgi:hypothetical protein
MVPSLTYPSAATTRYIPHRHRPLPLAGLAPGDHCGAVRLPNAVGRPLLATVPDAHRGNEAPGKKRGYLAHFGNEAIMDVGHSEARYVHRGAPPPRHTAGPCIMTRRAAHREPQKTVT